MVGPAAGAGIAGAAGSRGGLKSWVGALLLAAGLPGSVTPAGAQTPSPPELTAAADDPAAAVTASEMATWRRAVVPSLRLVFFEHTWRIASQSRTRRALDGDFLTDYVHSLKLPRGWSDGDPWKINYIGHSIHGAAAGFIWLDLEPGAFEHARFSKAYWASRGRAMLWAAVYSVQFEFGPLSEASIGNVGMHAETTGWVDHIFTPIGALALILAEEAIDDLVIERIESWTGNHVIRIAARIALNPSRSFAAMAQGRMPWYRAGRPLCNGEADR
jgi:hypothetical protein